MANEPTLNEWLTETREVDVAVPQASFNEKGELTGVEMVPTKREVSERVLYTKPVPQAVCDHTGHDFALLPNRVAGRLLVKCRRCPNGRQFIPGRDRIEDGKVISVERG